MSNNKIEYPSKKTYWIAKSEGEYMTHGVTETNQVTESPYDLTSYTVESKWKNELLTFGIDVYEEEKDVE